MANVAGGWAVEEFGVELVEGERTEQLQTRPRGEDTTQLKTHKDAKWRSPAAARHFIMLTPPKLFQWSSRGDILAISIFSNFQTNLP